MPFPVKSQVVGAAKRAVACFAYERLSTSVLAYVPRQLVGPREAPVAVLPRAEVRLLACRESRRLGEDESTVVGEETAVRSDRV